ncbi:MAG: hypothetical protein GF307_13655 [candidate division Zixibacteria bacterium]|nr:hypothetical protein [candidate division Zixibacteria bacterium]
MAANDYRGVGKFLWEQREAKKISLEDVRSGTRIQLNHLKAIESENYDQLPAEAYIAPFVKSYAKYLDVEIEPLIAENKKRDDEGEDGRRKEEKKDQPGRRWLQVGVFFFVSVAAIFAVGYNSEIIEKYTFVEPRDTNVRKPLENNSEEKLLLELMAFGSAALKISAGDDTLYRGELTRGELLRFRDRDMYHVTIHDPENIRIYANNFPLYVPYEETESLMVVIDSLTVVKLRDSLLIGETAK